MMSWTSPYRPTSSNPALASHRRQSRDPGMVEKQFRRGSGSSLHSIHYDYVRPAFAASLTSS